MANYPAFNFNGATPNNYGGLFTTKSPTAPQPQSPAVPKTNVLGAIGGALKGAFNAVNNTAKAPSPVKVNNPATGMSQLGQNYSPIGSLTGMFSTPVKSVSTTDSQGNTHVITTHNPSTDTSTKNTSLSNDSSLGSVNGKDITSGSDINTQVKNAMTPSQIGTGNTDNTQNTQNNQNTQTYTPPPVYSQATSGLLNIGQGADSQINSDVENLNNIIKTNYGGGSGGNVGGLNDIPLSQGVAGIENSTAPSNIKTGNLQAVENYNSPAYAQALNQYQADITKRGQNVTALNNAGSLTQPTANAGFFGSPESGSPVGGGGTLVANGVQNALSQALAGGDPVALKNSLISQFGAQAGVQFDNAYSLAKGGTYNPQAQSAQTSTNAAIGSQYQKQATDLSSNLANLDNTGATAQSILAAHPDLNSTNTPVGNQQIATYLENIGDTAAVSNYQSVINDLNRYKNAITTDGSGLTPSAATNQTLSTDPSSLSLPQLASYVQTIKKLGQSQHAVLTSISNGAYQANDAYSGTPTQVDTSSTATPGGGINNLNFTPEQTRQALAGLGINTAGYTANMLSNIGGEIAGYIAKAVTTTP